MHKKKNRSKGLLLLFKGAKDNHLENYHKIVSINESLVKSYPNKKIELIKRRMSKNKDGYMEGYKVITDSYENFINKLANFYQFAGINSWQKREWRILIGLWLSKFIQLCYDRYCLVNEAKEKLVGLDIEVNLHHKQINSLHTWGYEDLSKNCRLDSWNNLLLEKIVSNFKLHQLSEKIYTEENIKIKEKVRNKNIKVFIKKNIMYAYLLIKPILIYLKRRDKVVLYNLFMSKEKELKTRKNLNISLFKDQFFFENTELGGNILNKKDHEKRELMAKFIYSKEDNDFNKFVANLLIDAYPITYLEKINDLKKEVYKFSIMPKKAEFIFTGVGHWYNEYFKYWCAERVNSGSKLYVVQHGGEYGTALPNYGEDHERVISEKFLVWGWARGNKSLDNIEMQLESVEKSYVSKNQSRILFIAMELEEKDYVSQLHHNSLDPETLKVYLKNAGNIIYIVNNLLRRNVHVRFAPNHRGDNKRPDGAEKYLLNKGGIKSCYKKMVDDMNNSKLIILAHDSTPFLESIRRNSPTILFLDERTHKIRKEAVRDYHNLVKAKIVHRSMDSLKEHINYIKADINGWWYSKNTQLAKNQFIKYYAKEGNIINTIRKYVKS